ncbi:MAG: hypothetical protein JRF35_03765 [Deltaproteobacteria bacterium]|nr:hypothetical protein [Deltaproteobacteria bacterium]MBW2310178.1 hypothetical protein [Deltaproteobacteria bacterium]
MKYALFIAVSPKPDKNKTIAFLQQFEEEVQKKKEQLEGATQLLPGVWECNLDYGMQPLVTLVQLAPFYHMNSRVLFLDTSPSWVVTPIDKKP